MKTLEEVQRILTVHREELKEKYRVKKIGIFGSYARKEQRKTKDIDILVEFEEVPDLLKFINLERYLTRLLKKKVDLVEKSSIKPSLKNIILGEVVYP